MPYVTSPIALSSYPSTTEGNYIFLFSLQWDIAIQDPITELGYQIQIDSVSTFDSINLKTFSDTSANIVSFENDGLFKSFEISFPDRQPEVTQTWYWKVRINKASSLLGVSQTFTSAWTDTKSFTIYPDTSRSIAQSMTDSLADTTAYSKSTYSSNIDVLFRMFGKQIDALEVETLRTQDDNYINKARDLSFVNNFGTLANIEKSTTETYTEYRGRILALYKAFLLYGGLEQGVIDIVKAFTGIAPYISDYTRSTGWELDENYIYDPNHPTLEPYIILYTDNLVGFLWALTVYNYWNLSFDSQMFEDLIYDIIPDHTKISFNYPTAKKAALVCNSSSVFTYVDPPTVTSLTLPIPVYKVYYNAGYFWFGGSGAVSVFDPITNTTVATVAGATGGSSICFDGTSAWVSHPGGNRVYKINTTTYALTATVALGASMTPYQIIYAASYVWTVNYNNNSLKKIDINTNAVVATVAVGTKPQGICFDGTYLWVNNTTATTISKVDPVANAQVATVTIAKDYYSCVFDGTYVWTTGLVANNIKKINPVTNTVEATIAVPGSPYEFIYDGDILWITTSGINALTKFNPKTNAIVGTVSVLAHAYSVAYGRRYICVTQFDDTGVFNKFQVNPFLAVRSVGSDSSFGLTLLGANAGYYISPIYDLSSTLNSFGEFTYNDTRYGQTVTYTLYSSSDQINWSSGEVLTQGTIPSQTPIRRYITIRIDISSSNYTLYNPVVNSFQLQYFRS